MNRQALNGELAPQPQHTLFSLRKNGSHCKIVASKYRIRVKYIAALELNIFGGAKMILGCSSKTCF